MKIAKFLFLTAVAGCSMSSFAANSTTATVSVTGTGVTACAVGSPAVAVGTVVTGLPSPFVFSTSILVNCGVVSTLSTDALQYSLTVGSDSTTNKIEATLPVTNGANIFTSPIALAATSGQQAIPFNLKLSNGSGAAPVGTGPATATLNMILTY